MTRSGRLRVAPWLALLLGVGAVECTGRFPYGGGDGDVDVDVDADVDIDVDSDSDSDSDSDVPCQRSGDETWPCGQSDCAAPTFRITALHFLSPEGLTNALLQAIIDDAIDNFRLVWLLQANIDRGTVTTGAGVAEGGGFCAARWISAYPPSEIPVVPADLREDLLIASAEPARLVEIPIYTEESPDVPMLLLPLAMLSLEDLQIDPLRRLVGEPGAPPTSAHIAGFWETSGWVDAWITVEDARAVVIEDLGETLCGLLSGDHLFPGDPSGDCTSPVGTWPNPPEAVPGLGVPGYHMVAEVGAGAITIR